MILNIIGYCGVIVEVLPHYADLGGGHIQAAYDASKRLVNMCSLKR